MKRIQLAAAAVLALSLSVFSTTACSTTAPAQQGKTSLTFMTFETPALTAQFWDTSFTNAQKAVPDVTINKIVTPGADRDAYAKQLQASGQLPDLLASIDPKEYTAAGLLQPFDQAWLAENFLAPDGDAIGGRTYIPPTNAQVIPMVFYNKEIFQAQNLAVPTSWDEFVTVAKKLRAAGITPLEMAGGEPWSAGIPLGGIISADVIGGNPQWIQDRYAGKVKFTGPDMKAAVTKYRDLIAAGAFDTGALGVAYADANTQFLGGKAAMYPMGSWLIGQIKPVDAAKFGMFVLPSQTGEVVVPFVTGGTTAVNAKSPNAGKAMEFAKAWSLSEANLKTLIETDGAFPMFKKVPFAQFNATVTPVYDAGYKFVTDTNKKVGAFAQANNDDALAPGMNDAFNAMAQKLFTDGDIDTQLAALDAAWDKATKK